MTVRVVRVVQSFIDDRKMRVYDEHGEIDELVSADSLREALGYKVSGYFRAVRGAEGWTFKSRYRGRPLYW